MGLSQIAIYKSAGGSSYNATTLTDVTFATQIRQDSIYSRVDNVGVVLAEAGHYLVLYNLDLVSSGGTRGTIELQVLLDGASLAPNGTVSGYFRNSASAIIASPAGSCIVHASTADQVLKIQAKRTDSDVAMSVAEQASPISSLQIVKLSDTSQYLRAYASGTLALSTHNTFSTVPIDTSLELGSSAFALAGNAITLKNNRKFLISYSVSYNNASTTLRSSGLSRLTLDGTVVSGSYSEGYMRGVDGNNHASGCGGPILIETGDVDSTLLLQGSVQCTPTVQAITALAGHIDIIELPSAAKLSVARTVASTAMSTAGVLVPLDAEDSDTEGWHDNATNNTRITVPADGEYLTFGAFHTDRSVSTDTIRVITEVEVKVDGLSTGLSQASEYVRGDESAQDCLHAAASLGALHDLTAGQYVELYLRNTVGTTVGVWQTPGTALGMLSLDSIQARVVDISANVVNGSVLDVVLSRVVDLTQTISNANEIQATALLGNPVNASANVVNTSSIQNNPVRLIHSSATCTQGNVSSVSAALIISATTVSTQDNTFSVEGTGGTPVPATYELNVDTTDDPLLNIARVDKPQDVSTSWGVSYTTPVPAPGPVSEGMLQQTYVFGDTLWELTQTNARAMDVTAVLFELTQEYTIRYVEFCLEQEYAVDAGGIGTNLRQFELGQEYNIVGMAWVEELLGYINEHRANFGLIPYEGVWYPSSPDVAQGHSDNMAYYEIFAHESLSFPAGWQTIPDRIALLSDTDQVTGYAENLIRYEYSPSEIAIGNNWRSQYGSTFAPITPLTAFLLWRSSPPHNANMLWPWEEEDHPVMGFGLSTSNGDEVDNNIVSYLTQLFLAYGIPKEAVMQTFELTQSYDFTAAGVVYLSQEYALDALHKARKQHEAPYSVKVTAQHAAPYGYRTARQHEAPIHYSVVAAHEAPYTLSYPVRAQHEAKYSIDEYLFVSKQHEAVYGIRVTKQLESAYGDLVNVSKQHEAAYNIMSLVQRQLESPYSSSTPVSAQHLSLWDVLDYNPVRRAHTAYWTVGQDAILYDNPQTSVQIAGVTIPVIECLISSSETDTLWSCKLILEGLTHYSKFVEGAQFTVELQGEVYTFQYHTRDVRRSTVAEVVVTVEGLSPAMVLQAPRASEVDRTYDTDLLASDIIEDILGQPVTWEMPNWVIPKYRVAAQGAIPLNFAQSLVEAAGGLIESNLDGSLTVRSKYVVNLTDYKTTAVDQVYSDAQDNLSASDTYELRAGYNKFRVSDEDAKYQDTLEFVEDENSQTSGKLHVYPSPWRLTILVRTTDNSGMVFLGNEEWVTREETEIVEFAKGEASLSYPAESIDSLVWYSEVLEGIIHTPYAKSLSSGTLVNQGYGLAEITYTVRYLVYDTTAILGSSVQYVIEDI